MKVLEHEAKVILAGRGMLVPEGNLAFTPDKALAIAHQISRPVIIKAQVPTGGRMKAGGVKYADTPAEALAVAQDLIGCTLLGHQINSVLVEEHVASLEQFYIAVTYDNRTRQAVVLASRDGGIEIESKSKMLRCPFSLLEPIKDTLWFEMAAALRLEGDDQQRLMAVITKLVALFLESDALLLEINPLILNMHHQWCVADVHLEIDDDAVLRQDKIMASLPLSISIADQLSEFERKAAEIDHADHRGVAGRLVAFGGDLGLLIGGGGASLTIMDAIIDAGLKPANYCEIGGNPSVWKIKELTKLILSQDNVKQLAVIMNVVSNTRVDLVARGVIKGILEAGRTPSDVLIAFRIPGAWEDEGKAILEYYGVTSYGRDMGLEEIVEKIRWPS